MSTRPTKPDDHPGRPTRRLPRALLALAVAAGAGGAVVASAAPAGAVTGRTLVTVTSAADSSNKNVTATCPDDKVLVGTGGEILNSIGASGGYGEVLVTDIIPNSSLTSVTVQGGENGPYAFDWKVRAYAMCAPETAVSNMIRVSAAATNNNTSDSVKSSTAVCTGGRRLFGTGYEINDANGNVFPEKLEPDTGLTEVDGVARENDTFTGSWSWTTYAICGDARTTMTRVAAYSAYDSNTTHGIMTNPCAAGTTLTGAGFRHEGAVGWVLLDRMSLELFANTVTTNGWEDQPGGLAASWDEQAFAICVS